MKSWRVTAAVISTVVLIVAGGLWLNNSSGLRQNAKDTDLGPVQQIIDSPQTYDGEQIDKLTALGSNGVPYLGRALVNGEGFPLRFIYAIEKIGDADATRYLIEFIDSRKPLSSNDESTLIREAVKTLIAIDGKQSLSYMKSIYTDESAHPRVRLAAASVVTALSKGKDKVAADNFILDLSDNRNAYISDPNSGFTEKELEDALTYVND